jgi:site-specific DNA recombinase
MLASFMPVWGQLFPREKARILRLLVERVEYHAADGSVEIVFRPGGVRVSAMLRESKAANGPIRS